MCVYAPHIALEELGLEYSHVVDTFSSDYEDYFDEMGDDVLITLHYITKWPLQGSIQGRKKCHRPKSKAATLHNF